MRRARDGGFTLVEVLLAAAIVAVGLTGIAASALLSGYGSREGRELSTATFLAEERLEHVRGSRWTLTGTGASHDCLGLSATASAPPTTSACPGQGASHVTFADEPTGSLPAPFQRFSRAVRVSECIGSSACPLQSGDLRLVTVTVRYTPTSGIGGSASGATRPVVLAWLTAKKG